MATLLGKPPATNPSPSVPAHTRECFVGDVPLVNIMLVMVGPRHSTAAASLQLRQAVEARQCADPQARQTRLIDAMALVNGAWNAVQTLRAADCAIECCTVNAASAMLHAAWL